MVLRLEPKHKRHYFSRLQFRPIYTELPVGLLKATREAGSAYGECCLSGVDRFCAAATLAAS